MANAQPPIIALKVSAKLREILKMAGAMTRVLLAIYLPQWLGLSWYVSLILAPIATVPAAAALGAFRR